MKLLLLLAALSFAQACLAGIVIQNAVVTQQELQDKGVQIRKVAEEGTIQSYSVEIIIEFKKEAGSYRKCGLVVADTRVTPESLEYADARADKATRTEYTKEKVFNFTVIGREHERAFIVIEALTGYDRMPIYTRFLVTVASIKESAPEANHTAEPCSPSQAGSPLR